MPNIFDQMASGQGTTQPAPNQPQTSTGSGNIFDKMANGTSPNSSTTSQEPGFWKKAATTALDVTKGVGEGALDTVNLVSKGINKVGNMLPETPAGKIGDLLTGGSIAKSFTDGKNVHVSSADATAQAAHQDDLATPVNTAQKVGFGMENVAEFMLGDEVLKGLSVAAKLAKVAKAAKVIEESPALTKIVQAGLKSINGVTGSAIRQGVVGGAQEYSKTGDAGKAVTTGLTTGAVSGALGLAGKAGSAMLDAAGWAGKDAVATGEKLADSIASDGVGDQASKASKLIGAPADFIKDQTEEAATAGGKSIQTSKTQQGVLQHVKESINAASDNMHDTYNSAMSYLKTEAKDVPVNITGSKLQKVSTELLGNKEVPGELQKALKGIVPDADRLNPLLDEFSTSTKTYTWNEIEATRQEVGSAIRKLSMDSPVRNDLIKLRYAIDDTMQQAAKDSGNPQLANNIKSIRSLYAQSSANLDTNVIKQLADKQPDTVAKILTNSSSIFNVNTLRSTIGHENMKAVEGGVFRDLLERSMDDAGKFDGNALSSNFSKMSNSTKEAIWGVRLPEVTEFVKNAGSKLGMFENAASTGVRIYGGYKVLHGLATGNSNETMAGGGALLLGVGAHGGAIHLPFAALSNPTVLRGVGTLLKGVGGVQGRKALSAITAAVMNDGQKDGE